MTIGLLTTVRKVTLNFLLVPKDADMTAYESPLHAFICFLTFEKRPEEDPVFMDWIKDHYNGIKSALVRFIFATMLT
jgi:hypothetical protein